MKRVLLCTGRMAMKSTTREGYGFGTEKKKRKNKLGEKPP